MVKVRDHYDWIVLGDHPGALLSAGLASRLGLSVLIVPVETPWGLQFSPSGEFLDPESNFLLGNGPEGLVGKCLKAVGLLPAEEQLLQTRSGLSQILSPSSRVDLRSWEADPAIWQRDLGFSEADSAAFQNSLLAYQREVLQLWDTLPDRLTVDLRAKSENSKSVLAKTPDYGSAGNISPKSKVPDCFSANSDGWRGFTRALEFAWAGRWVDASNNQNAARTLSLGGSGASFIGGWTAYRDLLFRLARRGGADVPAQTECSRVFVEKGRFGGIQLTHQGQQITGGAALLGCSVERIRSKLTFSGTHLFKKLKSPPGRRGWKFTIAVTVNIEAIPPGMSERAVWCEAGSPPLEIEVAKPTDYGVRDAEHRVVFVRTAMPYTAESLSPAFQRVTATRMFRQLLEILPFFEYHVKKIYPDFRTGTRTFLEALSPKSPESELTPEAELRKIYGFQSLDAIPDSLLCLDEEGIGIQSGIENLYCASPESFPNLGTLGPFVAGIEATAWLAHRSGLPGPVAR
jgi:hypothetical protein